MNNTLENCPLTLNTTRICSNDPIDTAIEVSKIGFSNMKPNAVILVNKKDVFDAIAATSLIHFPINASLLLIDGNSLNKETLKEIQRLSPNGYKGIHVILVGNISKNVSSELNHYGFRTHHIAGRNHYETACMISKIRKEFKNILIMSGEEYSEGIVSGYWSAHHGDPILFVQKIEFQNVYSK
ncbi:MAG: cell wall-binding repeat-containing protein [Clostridium sp.]|uniref:cell wall-binding repeat-containing protein n=1 Tax=Clostridium sp. TaxID=1506 RepID=UPI0025C270D7|nr:cell wall-binding repeat-containing protein [Clostridium sp.]MCE5220560.1 cell wall-binding repeat-containing protein [Clostridium sp.]